MLELISLTARGAVAAEASCNSLRRVSRAAVRKAL